MAPKQPVYKAIGDFDGNYLKVADKILLDVRKAVAGGASPDAAVVAAWNRHGIETKLEGWIVDGAVYAVSEGALKTVTNPKAMGDFLLSQVWDKSGLTLSEQIHQLSGGMQDVIADTISDQLRRGNAWNATAKAVDDLHLTSGDISGTIDDLDKYARQSLAGNPAAAKQYKKAIKKAQAHVDKLASGGANPRRLRRAYQSVINATERGSVKALDTAMDRAVKAKARYNAGRVARAEMAKAYGQGVVTRVHADGDAKGWAWQLSNMHSLTDVCNFHAEADMYGMGPGVYPKDQGPPYPAHPGCLCVLSPVYRPKTDTPKYDQQAGEKYLKRNPDKQRALLGKGGKDRFGETPNEWQNNLNSWQGQEQKIPTIPEGMLE